MESKNVLRSGHIYETANVLSTLGYNVAFITILCES